MYHLGLSGSDLLSSLILSFFFFNDTATTEIYTLSLHDALPISRMGHAVTLWSARGVEYVQRFAAANGLAGVSLDRKSTRLNSSHANISYAVFCLKKKKNSHKHDDENQTEHKQRIDHDRVHESGL